MKRKEMVDLINEMYPESRAYQEIVVRVPIGQNTYGIWQAFTLCRITPMQESCLPSCEKIMESDVGNYQITHSWPGPEGQGSGGVATVANRRDLIRHVQELQKYFAGHLAQYPESFGLPKIVEKSATC